MFRQVLEKYKSFKPGSREREQYVKRKQAYTREVMDVRVPLVTVSLSSSLSVYAALQEGLQVDT